MKSLQKCLVYLTILILIKNGYTQKNPCPNMWQYFHEGTRTIGLLRLTNIKTSPVKLSVVLSIGAPLGSSYIGEIKTSSPNIDNELQTTGALVFKIYFPIEKPVPLLNTVSINGAVICSGSAPNSALVSTVKLDYKIVLNQNSIIKAAKKNRNQNQNLIQLNINGNSNNNNNRIRQQSNNVIRKQTQNVYQNIDEVDDVEVQSKKLKIKRICGTTDKTTSLIVNGTITHRGDYPWHVAIFKKKDDGINFICGGTLISDQHVLTAAHCLNNGLITKSKISSFLIMLGKYKLNRYNEPGSALSEIVDIKIHSDFIPPYPDADIGIIKLESPVKFSNFIHPICLYSSAMLKEINNKIATVVGWGRNEEGKAVTNDLKSVKIRGIDSEICRRSNPKYENIVTSSTFCGEGVEKGNSPCNGDSGGGMVMKIKNRWYLRGIVSASLAVNDSYIYCNPHKYFILVDSRRFYTWITDNVFYD